MAFNQDPGNIRSGFRDKGLSESESKEGLKELRRLQKQEEAAGGRLWDQRTFDNIASHILSRPEKAPTILGQQKAAPAPVAPPPTPIGGQTILRDFRKILKKKGRKSTILTGGWGSTGAVRRKKLLGTASGDKAPGTILGG